MLSDQAITADTAAIRADLEYMTARWGELTEPVVFEVRAFKEDAKTYTAKFAADWIDEAVEWIENVNKLEYNIYVVRNPVRHDFAGEGAKDEDVVASFFLWADCDDPAAAGNVHRFDGPKWAAAVTTGSIPSIRVHTYWALEGVCTDMVAWRAMQQTIASHFASDPSVINPSRIMRVGGTVAYPSKKKRERGYVTELTKIRTEYDEARKAVTLDQMARVFGATTPAAAPKVMIDTGAFETLDRERTAIQALSGEAWNIAVFKLVGSYVRKGLSDGEVHALTDPLTLGGYTVEETRTEVQKMIDRTRKNPKFESDEQHTPNFDHAPAPSPSLPAPKQSAWQVQTAGDFVADFVAPEYLIDGIAQRGRLYTLTAPTGHGKTAVMLYAAMSVATGNEFCNLEIEHGDVLFLAGENPDDVRARVIATMEFYNIDPDKCRLHFIAGTFSIRADMERLHAEAAKLPNLVLVVIDTFAAYFDGEDENSNAQALDFARVARSLTVVEGKPAVIMPAHPIKNAQKGNLTPKGGSSLLNEVDGNLTLWNNENTIEMHWHGKHRGADFEPLRMELQKFECDRLKDRKGRIMPTILAKPLSNLRALQIAQDTLSREDHLLLNIDSNPALSLRDRCVALRMINDKGEANVGGIQRLLKRLTEQKLIKKFRTNWELTDPGKKAVAMIENGSPFAEEI